MSAELLYQRLYIFRGAKPVGHVVREEAITPTDSLMRGQGSEKTKYPRDQKFLKSYENIKSLMFKVNPDMGQSALYLKVQN